MRTLLLWILRHPFTSTALLLAGILLAGLGLFKIQIDPSIDGLILNDEDKAYYEKIKQTFGDDSVLVVYLKSDQLFSTPVLQTIENLTFGLQDITLKPPAQGSQPFFPVTQVRSLATVKRIEGNRDPQTGETILDTTPLMDGVPTHAADLAALKQRTLKSELFRDDLISKDGQATAINAFIAAAPDGFLGYDQALVDAVEVLLEQERVRLKQAGIHADLFSVGVPVAKADLGRYIMADMLTLVPIALGLIFVILALAFRSVTAMILPSITGALSAIAAVGVMGWLGYEINLISNIVPLLLLVIGCTEDIHMLADYADETREGHPKLEAIRNMILKSAIAISLTSLTTIMGFASLASNPITMLQEFGIASALGLFFNFLITIVLIPVLLLLFPVPESFRHSPQRPANPWVTQLAHQLIHWFKHRRLVIILLMIAVFLGSSWQASTVIVNTDLLGLFQEDAPIRQKMDTLAEHLSGGQSFSIVVETHRIDGAKDPQLLQAMLQFQTELEQGPFDKVISIANYLRALHRESNGGDPAFDVVPDRGIAAYLLLLEGSDLDRLLESTYERTLIVVRHHITGSWQLNREVEQIYQLADRLLPGYVSIKITGQNILFNKASDNMAEGQVYSLILAMFSIFVVISLLFVSVKAGLLAMLPNIIPIFTTFGFMGLLDIPLSPGTCLVAVIALGIAVDDTIHLMAGFHQNMKTTTDQMRAMEITLHQQLTPVLFTSVALGLGFAILGLSEITSSRDFGILGALAMLSALISDLALTPTLLVSTQLVSSWDMLMVRINRQTIANSPLLGNFTLAECKRVLLLGVVEQRLSGETVVSQGDRTQDMYLLLEGEANVLSQQTVLSQLKPGDIFGEMAFVTGESRTADVVARTDISILKLDHSALSRILKRFPKVGCKLLLNISQILSRRLGETTQSRLTESP